MQYIRGVECPHFKERLFLPWTDPVKIGEDKLWILAEQTRTCRKCGFVLRKSKKVPKNNAMSRSHVYEVDPG